jgi:hypothetical protein
MKRARIALGVFSLLVLVGAALLLGGSRDSKQSAPSGFAVASGDPDASSKMDTASVEAGPTAVTAAEEAFAQRAYPADDIPVELSLNAQKAWSAVKARANGKGKNTVGQWTMVGPSHADMPGLLVFSGADYTTSGRVTALALDPACTQAKCRMWVGAAGGGVWRTTNALSGSPSWTFVSGGLPTNAIGTLTYDAASDTLYAGTGEPNASADSEAGLGLFKSTDGGDTWTHLAALTTTAISGTWTNKDAFLNRAISAIVVDPTDSNTLYVGSASSIRGVCSVSNGCNAAPLTPLPARGVYKSTDGGATFTLLNGTTLPFVLRGVTDIKLDPSDHNTIYAAQFGQGVYRSTNGGASWTQIFTIVNPANAGAAIERYSLAPTTLPNGKTRLYLGVGDNGTFAARLYRTDDAATVTPATWTNLTNAQSAGYCTAQCWYDNVVYSPPGRPDTVYLGGSYDYPNAGTFALNGNHAGRTNGRAFIVSNDGGVNFNDITRDASSDSTPNGMHPDSHAIAVSPTNPDVVFFGSDGGLVRTSGDFADVSSQCATRGLTPANGAICDQLLSRVPTRIYSLNKGLSTLQFQSLSVNPTNPKNLMGGTQDNGTFSTDGSGVVWNMDIWGDGGQSGFSASNPAYRVNTFTGQANDANFQGGDPAKWVVISGDVLSSPEGAYFYPPVTADPNPANGGTIYQGSFSVWRTQDWGGDSAFLEANCSEFGPGGVDHSADPACGDFERIGPAGHTDLRANDPLYGGADRSGTDVAAIERAPGDTSTLWAATGAGRVFVSKNADAAAGSVNWTRIDSLPGATADPGRFVSSIFVDPANANHAWISYSGYNANTPTTPGHVFDVTYDPGAGTATWTNLDGPSGSIGDLPVTDLVRDSATGDLYASTDFGVAMLAGGNIASGWTAAGAGLPTVEVAGLTIVPGARKLYAATHGRSAWSLTLP